MTRCRAFTWRRPTLTGPVVPLPLALRRFTSGFGMGPGGSTTLWLPEGICDLVSGYLLATTTLTTGFLAVLASLKADHPCRCYQPTTHVCHQPLGRSLTSTRRLHKLHSFLSIHLHMILCAIPLEKAISKRNQAIRMISTGKLHILLHLHFQPINVVVFHDPSGKIHLGRSLALRCFQRLSLPHLATRPCS